MSQLASFFVLDKTKFNELCKIAESLATLKANKQERAVLKHDAWSRLEQFHLGHWRRKLDLRIAWCGARGVERVVRSAWWYLFDTKVQHSYLERLGPARYDESEISEWLKRNGFNDSPELRTGMLDGICIFHEYISMLDDNFVVLFRIGSVEPFSGNFGHY